ncbi:histidine phosphatase family protein [Marinobacter sp. AN1]|uniref:histidine phosphatase family protein n=1 Tax=Marinobacter sp. AN1 TaxID=2886046 RepID=UPI0039B6F46F
MTLRRLACSVLLLLLSAMTASAVSADEEAWKALQEGRALLMLRHALAPGTGDPENFALDDCSTQRNLNDRGREQARAWKELLWKHGIGEARVYTSQWCRSRDTATEMAIGKVTEWPPLNSFFAGRGNGDMQTRQTIALVNALKPGLPVVLVSHQVNITRLTGVYPSSGEGVIIALPLSDNPTILATVMP